MESDRQITIEITEVRLVLDKNKEYLKYHFFKGFTQKK